MVDDLRKYELKADNECFVVEKTGEKAVIADASKREEVEAYSYMVIRDNYGNLKVLPIATQVEGRLEELASAKQP